MTDDINLGQGINALIPPKKQKTTFSGLEGKIEDKVNDSLIN